jgi:hypothetical protein
MYDKDVARSFDTEGSSFDGETYMECLKTTIHMLGNDFRSPVFVGQSEYTHIFTHNPDATRVAGIWSKLPPNPIEDYDFEFKAYENWYQYLYQYANQYFLENGFNEYHTALTKVRDICLKNKNWRNNE